MNILVFFYLFQVSRSDWVSDWLAPIREHYKETSASRLYENDLKISDEDHIKNIPLIKETKEIGTGQTKNNIIFHSNPFSASTDLKFKLETALQNAKKIAAALKEQIFAVQAREQSLKEAIVNGRTGVTVLIVSTLKTFPRKYIIRDGFWTLCNGIIQEPRQKQDTSARIFGDTTATPRCIGQEVQSHPDSCVFNSLIKYETIPTERIPVYSEDEYLCLKHTFNNTMEQYFSVTEKIVNDTCKQGTMKSFADNVKECGIRTLSDYTYYPTHFADAHLPLEYCDDKLGSCKLIVAWHVSNVSIENFEFMKDDNTFKDFFLKSNTYI